MEAAHQRGAELYMRPWRQSLHSGPCREAALSLTCYRTAPSWGKGFGAGRGRVCTCKRSKGEKNLEGQKAVDRKQMET